MRTYFTVELLLDAGLSNEMLKELTAAFFADIENVQNDVRELLREHTVTTDAGCATPAAVRMRKMRENRRRLKEEDALIEGVREANTVTEQPVTSDNILSLSKGIDKEESKPVVIARGRKKINYTVEFEIFWKAFPTDKLMSKPIAFKEFSALDDEDKALALSSIPAFKAHIATLGGSYRTVHACRYLSQRRFENFIEKRGDPGQESTTDVYIMAGTDQWHLWERYWLQTKGKKPPRDSKGGWWFKSEWPPSQSEAA